jgi:protein TonB
MFEQAVLANHSDPKRLWSTCAGVTAQTLLVLAAFLAPAIWPEVLPHAQLLASLVAPGVPEREAPPQPTHPTAQRVPTHPFQIHEGTVLLPGNAPEHAAVIEDPPGALATQCTANCVPGATGEGSSELLKRILSVAPPFLVRPIEKPVVPQPPAPPVRLRGGDVNLGEPVYRVEPHYPPLAIAAHISGRVELEGVVGTDGRIRELRALSGNPLLVPAALDAVRQWIYRPTLLNGKPVEVAAPITVNFRLTR